MIQHNDSTLLYTTHSPVHYKYTSLEEVTSRDRYHSEIIQKLSTLVAIKVRTTYAETLKYCIQQQRKERRKERSEELELPNQKRTDLN